MRVKLSDGSSAPEYAQRERGGAHLSAVACLLVPQLALRQSLQAWAARAGCRMRRSASNVAVDEPESFLTLSGSPPVRRVRSMPYNFERRNFGLDSRLTRLPSGKRAGHSAQAPRVALDQRFRFVEIDIVGCAALFVAKDHIHPPGCFR